MDPIRNAAGDILTAAGSKGFASGWYPEEEHRLWRFHWSQEGGPSRVHVTAVHPGTYEGIVSIPFSVKSIARMSIELSINELTVEYIIEPLTFGGHGGVLRFRLDVGPMPTDIEFVMVSPQVASIEGGNRTVSFAVAWFALISQSASTSATRFAPFFSYELKLVEKAVANLPLDQRKKLLSHFR